MDSNDVLDKIRKMRYDIQDWVPVEGFDADAALNDIFDLISELDESLSAGSELPYAWRFSTWTDK